MKKLLSLVALAGLICGVFYASTPKAEATTHSSVEDPVIPPTYNVCDPIFNPYKNKSYLVPWPGCPEGEALDLLCVAIEQTKFDLIMEAVDAKSAADWMISCYTEYAENFQSYRDNRACREAGVWPIMLCDLTCMGEYAASEWDREQRDQATEDAHQAALDIALADATAAMEDCCEEISSGGN